MRLFTLIAVIAVFSVSAMAEVGWCGEIWPNSGSERPVGEAIAVYFQIWKDGVTDSPGRGEEIAATLYWREAGTAVWSEIHMDYNTDVGNNDEYTADIPAPTSEGIIEFYCEALDSTDMISSTGTDQNDVALSDSIPGEIDIVDVTEIDVTVTFQVDMSLETVTGAVTVSGSFNGWSPDADTLTDPDMDDIYTADILFSAGSSPGHEYKFVNSGVYESTSNRALTIDDSSPTMVLPVAYFENRDPADYTDIEVMVHFSVDMTAETVTDPYVAGSVFPLVWGWDVGWNDSLRLYDDGLHDDGAAGDGIYGAHIWFPAGSYRMVEYKYTTDGTDNEPLPPFENHSFELGDSPHQFLPIDLFGSLENVDEKFLPEDFAVDIAPNPFNSVSNISVRIPENGNVQLDIFDIHGRLMVNIHDGQLSKGVHSFVWNAFERSSGLYLLRVRAGNSEKIEKIFLVK